MKNTRKSLWRLLFKFHRYTGLCVAIIIIMLAITGILLNHTENLKLDSHYVNSSAILDWYGIKPGEMQSTYKTNKQWVIQIAEQIFLEQQPVLKKNQPLLGAVATDSFYLLGFPNSLVLLSYEGDIIEQIQKPISKIAISGDQAIFIESEKLTLFSDDGLLSWQQTQRTDINWSKPAKLPERIKLKVRKLSLNRIIPYERLILDIHSGRFFGSYGTVIIDIAGILFILLAFSGCWIWLRHILRHHKHRKMQ